jgi:KDO2-lipid IV(A) lauroyltransferase
MTRRQLQYRIEALIARGFLALLRGLGPAAASNLGGFLARHIGPILPVTRTGDANLRRALPELNAAARARILRDVWDNLGRVVAEFPHLAALRRTETGPGWEIDAASAAVLHDLASHGGPAIFVSAHIGNWEMVPPIAATFGINSSSFYRAASNPEVDAIITALRLAAMRSGIRYFPKGARGARDALAHLSRGGYLGMLVDQKMNDGIESTLFGLPAMTAPAAAAFARRFKCPVIPAHIERLGPARLRLVVQPPLPQPDTADRQADIASLTQTINDTLESWIRARPGEWLWLHRRWPKQ